MQSRKEKREGEKGRGGGESTEASNINANPVTADARHSFTNACGGGGVNIKHVYYVGVTYIYEYVPHEIHVWAIKYSTRDQGFVAEKTT